MAKQAFSKSVSVAGNRPTGSINFHTNNNSMIVQGTSEDGRVDEAILFSDPDYAEKVRAAFEKIKAHQRAELEAFVAGTLDRFDEQLAEMESALEEHLEDLEAIRDKTIDIQKLPPPSTYPDEYKRVLEKICESLPEKKSQIEQIVNGEK